MSSISEIGFEQGQTLRKLKKECDDFEDNIDSWIETADMKMIKNSLKEMGNLIMYFHRLDAKLDTIKNG